MKCFMYACMLLCTGLIEAAFAEEWSSQESYLTGCGDCKPQKQRKVCRTGPTGPTGPTGFLAVNYGSFSRNDSHHPQLVPSVTLTAVEVPDNLVTPVGVTTSASGSIFQVASSGVYTVSWILTFSNVGNNTASGEDLFLFDNTTSSMFAPTQSFLLPPGGVQVVSGSEVVNLVSTNTYSLIVDSSATSNEIAISTASISVVQIAD